MPKFVQKIFPKSLDTNLSDYPNETTIHGVKYLANRSRPLADRIFWIIIFILSISFLSYFVYKIGRTWMENPVTITDENKPTYIYEIPFPAVTICPQIKIKRDKFNFSNLAEDIKQFANRSHFMNTDFGKQFVMASQICRRAFQAHIQSKVQNSKVFEDTFEFEDLPKDLPEDWINILHGMSPTFNEVFSTCALSSWDQQDELWNVPSKKNCERLFSTIVTNEGVCFTFNTISDILRMDSLQTDFPYHNITMRLDGWDPETGYTKANVFPYKGIVKGVPIGSPGLKLVLNANMSDATPYCFAPNVGYKIVFHSPSAYPQTYENFIPLASGKEYKIGVIPKTIKTNDDLKSFAPNVRNCYYDDERKLKFYTFYNEQNCRLECYANFSTIILNGAPFSSPRGPYTINRILPHKNFGWELPEYFDLLNEHLKQYGEPKRADEAVGYFVCDCLPECNSIKYNHEILKSNEDFSHEVIEGDVGDTNMGNTQTTIEIIFDKPTFIGQKRIRMYTFESMISDFGGLMGLFMGGSILSFFELFYFLTIRNCFKSNRNVVPA